MYILETFHPDTGRLSAAQEKPKSLAAEVLPLLALVVGVPMIIWYAEYKKKRERFERARRF